jgi:hypothetical protein
MAEKATTPKKGLFCLLDRTLSANHFLFILNKIRFSLNGRYAIPCAQPANMIALCVSNDGARLPRTQRPPPPASPASRVV